MKKFLILCMAVALTASASAQESLLYGMRGNPNTLKMNPGAETGTAFWLGLPTVTSNLQFTRPLAQYLGDVNGNFNGFTEPTEQITTQVDLELVSIGAKLGKSLLLFGSLRNQLDARFALDNDLARFALNGMRDLNGTIDPNYQGNFNELALGFSDRITASLGVQVKINPKLTVGTALNRSYLLAETELCFDKLYFNSKLLPNGLNELSIAAEGRLTYHGLLDQSMGQDLETLLNYLGENAASDYLDLAWEMPSYTSIDLGGTYRPIKKLRITGSVLGIGTGVNTARGFQSSINNSLTSAGFQWSTADSSQDPLDSFLQQFRDSLRVDFNLFSPISRTIKPFQSLHLAGYWDLNKWNSVGVRYSKMSRPSLSYSAMAIEYHVRPTKGWQISGAYTQFLSGSQPMSPQLSLALQMRILPPLQLFLASSTFGTLPSYRFSTQELLVPTRLDRLNISVGLNFVFFERKVKGPKQEKKTKE